MLEKGFYFEIDDEPFVLSIVLIVHGTKRGRIVVDVI